MLNENPIWGNKYDRSIRGMKEWAVIELNNGLPVIYALTGFLFMTTFLSTTLGLARVILGWTTPLWAFPVVLFLGFFWAFGGWIEGKKERDRIEDEMDVEELEQEYKYE